MTSVLDISRNVMTPVLPCRVCGTPIYFGLTAKGKRNPYDLDAIGAPTRISHFTTCPKVAEWRKGHPKS